MVDSRNRLQWFGMLFKQFGSYGFAIYLIQKLIQKFNSSHSTYKLRSRYAKYPLSCRRRTSDIDVFFQIFIEREYSCLDDVHGAELIIDCGANAGYSSAYFLSRYERAHVIAVEPDPQNYEMLTNNVRAYGDRCSTINAAIWPEPTQLVLCKNGGDSREWARNVRKCEVGENADVNAIDIDSLLCESSFSKISILKIDIEGSEAMLFGHNYPGWLGKVDNLVIELHGKECEEVFYQAINQYDFDITRCGELTVCKRKDSHNTI